MKEESNCDCIPSRNRDTGKWFLFNDAHVSEIDPATLEYETFGGEMEGYDKEMLFGVA